MVNYYKKYLKYKKKYLQLKNNLIGGADRGLSRNEKRMARQNKPYSQKKDNSNYEDHYYGNYEPAPDAEPALMDLGLAANVPTGNVKEWAQGLPAAQAQAQEAQARKVAKAVEWLENNRIFMNTLQELHNRANGMGAEWQELRKKYGSGASDMTVDGAEAGEEVNGEWPTPPELPSEKELDDLRNIEKQKRNAQAVKMSFPAGEDLNKNIKSLKQEFINKIKNIIKYIEGPNEYFSWPMLQHIFEILVSEINFQETGGGEGDENYKDQIGYIDIDNEIKKPLESHEEMKKLVQDWKDKGFEAKWTAAAAL